MWCQKIVSVLNFVDGPFVSPGHVKFEKSVLWSKILNNVLFFRQPLTLLNLAQFQNFWHAASLPKGILQIHIFIFPQLATIPSFAVCLISQKQVYFKRFLQ